MYTPYASPADYAAIIGDGLDVTEEMLRTASRHIDALTFNRIVAKGFENLTMFQQDVIREVVCRQALFEAENKSLIDMVLSSYSINGVAMQFGPSWNVVVESGVAMARDTYSLLEQTGLCCRVAGRFS